MKRQIITFQVEVPWEVEYDFGTGFLAHVRATVFDWALRGCRNKSLVRIDPIRGGAQAVADAIAVESVIKQAAR